MSEIMKVSAFECDDSGNEVLIGEGYIADFIGDSDEQEAARTSLQTQGRYWAGGGAEPLVLLTAIRS